MKRDLVTRALAIYSGQDQLGWALERAGRFEVFTADGKLITTVPTLHQAIGALPEKARA